VTGENDAIGRRCAAIKKIVVRRVQLSDAISPFFFVVRLLLAPNSAKYDYDMFSWYLDSTALHACNIPVMGPRPVDARVDWTIPRDGRGAARCLF
jgi:hypothetical protein